MNHKTPPATDNGKIMADKNTEKFGCKPPREEQSGRTVLLWKDIVTPGPRDGRRPTWTELSTGWASFLALKSTALRQSKLSFFSHDTVQQEMVLRLDPQHSCSRVWGLTRNYASDRSWFEKKLGQQITSKLLVRQRLSPSSYTARSIRTASKVRLCKHEMN